MKRILTLILATASLVLASCECCKTTKADSCCADDKPGASCCAEPGKGGAQHKH